MSRLTLILGGARSGKSRMAQTLASREKNPVVFIATARPSDPEMARRIRRHQLSRPRHWALVEAPLDLPQAVASAGKPGRTLLVDCLGLYLSNLLMDGLSDRAIESRVSQLDGALARCRARVLLVSNEVGCGIVPENALARRFRDLIGSAHQKLARRAATVVVMHAGLPLILKGELA